MQSYGPKADNLRLLKEAGFSVPDFYVIPAGSKEEGLLKKFRNWKQVNRIKLAAVRSSADGEDSQTMSFAGQFDTVLGVGTDKFLLAVRKVSSSRPSKAYSQDKAVVNIIIQEFIEPDVAGVIFSINPSSGASEYIINAASGRGTAVVEGKESSQFIVDRLTGRIHVASSADKKLLTNKQILRLTELMPEIEELFGSLQDVEWAIRDNEIFILQARPITSLSHLRLWDSSNLAESYPGIVMPLTFSVARRGYQLGYQAQAYEGGLSWYDLEANKDIFSSMIGIFNGRMYYNLLNWYRYISLFPGSKKNQKFLDDQIATQGEAIYLPPRKLSATHRVKYVIRLIYRALFFKRELHKFYIRYEKFEKNYSILPAHGDSQLLMRKYAHIQQTIIPHFGRTLDNDFLVMAYNGWLKHLLRRWLPNEDVEKTNVIGAISGVASAKQATDLYHLASMFHGDEVALRLLKASNYRKLHEHLSASKIESRINDYLIKFGHRFAEDQKIESINPVLQPHGMYQLLQVYIQLDSKQITERIKQAASSATWTEDGIKSKIKPLQRFVYALLLNKLKRHLKIREHNRLLRGRVFGYMRELFPRIGHAFVNEGVLSRWDDIYYLEIDEIEQITSGALNSKDLSSRIRSRRQDYNTYRNIAMPERFITRTLPNLEKIKAPARKPSGTRPVTSISGLISSPGTVEGRVVVLTEPKIPSEPFDILVASHTDPGWTPLIALAKGVVVEHGGMLSHAAIVTRELGIPSIIGVPDATQIIKTGMRVRINTQTSRVEVIDL